MPRISTKEDAFRSQGHVADIIRCANPTDEDFDFTYMDDNNNALPYKISAGTTRSWPRYIVSHYAKHFIDHLLTNEGVQINVESKREDWFDKLVLGEEGEEASTSPAVEPKKENNGHRRTGTSSRRSPGGAAPIAPLQNPDASGGEGA